jgi:N-methylhydantoinase A/oxoprolinase/acetone carboxylase beta subunit
MWWWKEMANLALGIDTGGTFTDGVIFDLDQKNSRSNNQG